MLSLAPPRAQGKREAGGFAVLELFTSEGCSSCPPADQVLKQLRDDYADEPVLPLSFHVDYWNSLGWKDPFSAAAYSMRQRRYAQILGEGRVYTPQLVVNGQTETVGSRADTIRTLIQRALAKPTDARMALAAMLDADGQVELTHRVTHANDNTLLTLLLVQDHATSKVARGENASMTLQHVNVVRSLSSVDARAAHSKLRLPDGLAPQDASVVALLEDRDTHAILAMARARLR